MEREISVFGKIRFSSLVPVVELDRGQHRPGESAATVIATIQIREFSFLLLLFSSLSISPIFLSFFLLLDSFITRQNHTNHALLEISSSFYLVSS